MNWNDTLKKIGKRILIGVVSFLGIKAITNVIDGKDILGKKVTPKVTTTDYKGDVHLGTNDYEVV